MLCTNPVHDDLCLFLNIKIKAWLADKDAEALRCQNLLVEEEEAARRRYVPINCNVSHIGLLNPRFSNSNYVSSLISLVLCLEQTS